MVRFPSFKRWLAFGAPLVVAGCSLLHSEKPADYDPRMPPPLTGGRASADAQPSSIRTVGYQTTVPGPLPLHVQPVAAAVLAEAPVTLSSILHMAEAQNTQIALARLRVDEAVAAECNANSCQLSQLLTRHCASTGDESVNIGSGRYAAAARTWQRRAELARTTNEVLLDAGNTYIDLLTARHGEAIGHELEKYQESLLHRAEDLAKTDRSATVLVESLRAEMAGRSAAESRLHQQAESAAAKLAYLLNLPPETRVVPPDTQLDPIDLVDATPPASALIQRAQANGPGVHELSGLMATIQEGIDSVHPCLARLPRFARQIQMAQGKLEETRLALEDVRGKLAAGVLDARGTIQSGRVQITESTQHIRHAAETYRLSDLRLKQNAPGASTNDVSQSIRSLEFAHLAHLTAVASYNKAQLRLLLLLGREEAPATLPLLHP
jgi:hypothetical protein